MKPISAALYALAAFLCTNSCVYGQVYCLPNSSPCTGTSGYIESFSTHGGVDSISSLNTGYPASGNYTYFGGQVASGAPGDTIHFILEINSNATDSAGVKLWIDWNENGSLNNTGEQVYSATGILAPGSIVNGDFVIPSGALPGVRRLRVKTASNSTTFSPCASGEETEDYVLDVLPPPCSGVPVAGIISPSYLSACPGVPVPMVLSGFTVMGGISFQWEETTAGAGLWAPIAGATGISHTVSPLVAMQYHVVVTCANAGAPDITGPALVVPACPSADSVWAGDADHDFVVDNYDPLAIAVAYGDTGLVRTGATTNWQAEFSTDWLTAFGYGVNHKHADCNGDGIIDNNDLAAVAANFGLAHLKGYSNPGFKTTAFPDLHFNMSGVALVPGTTVTVPLAFGTNGIAVNSAYGIAGTAVVVGLSLGGSTSMSIDSTWFGMSVNTLQFTWTPNPNTVYWAFARIDHQPAYGFGNLGSISFDIPTGAIGQIILHLQGVKVVDWEGAEVTDYNVQDDTGYIVESGIAPGSSGIQNMSIVPNPSADKAGLALTLYQPMDARLDISDLTGRCLWTMAIEGNEGQQLISLPAERFSAGIYLVKLSSNTQSYSKVVKWIRQ